MNNLKSTFFMSLTWTVIFSVNYILFKGIDNLDIKTILFLVFFAFLFSIPSTILFKKAMKKQLKSNDKIDLDLDSNEVVHYRENANMQKGPIRVGGVLFLTNIRICFLPNDLASKKETCFQRKEIEEIKIENNKIMLQDKCNNRYSFYIENTDNLEEALLL